METMISDLLQRLRRGPSLLFLGQRHLSTDPGGDPLLAQVASKYKVEAANYDAVLNLRLAEQADVSLAWLDERCRRIPAPRSTEVLADFAWSTVVTSAIDTVWTGAFRKAWRDLQPVVDERYRPSDPRNRSRLHCLFLYGNVNRTDPRERVPLTPFERLQRNQIAQALARRIPELVTPLGTLLVEGYAGEEDWLKPEVLAPVLAELNPQQVHFFEASAELASHPVLSELERRGIAIFHQTSLATALIAGEEAGIIKFGPTDAGGDLHQITLEDTTIRVPSVVWNRVRTAATVLDDAVLAPPPRQSADAR